MPVRDIKMGGPASLLCNQRPRLNWRVGGGVVDWSALIPHPSWPNTCPLRHPCFGQICHLLCSVSDNSSFMWWRSTNVQEEKQRWKRRNNMEPSTVVTAALRREMWDKGVCTFNVRTCCRYGQKNNYWHWSTLCNNRWDWGHYPKWRKNQTVSCCITWVALQLDIINRLLIHLHP